jgi:hypothetical protein
MGERLEILKRFQKCLRRATAASTPGEAEAAEAAARRLMEVHQIDPTKLTDKSLYDHTNFADNALLRKLREEHIVKNRPKPKPAAKPAAKPATKPPVVNTTDKPGKSRSTDRHLEPNRDRHSPGYMREYMARRRAAQKRGNS